MAKASKATKKFQKNHLGRELTKRKHDQKKRAQHEKSLAKYKLPPQGDNEDAAGSAPEDDDEDDEENGARANADETDVFSAKAKSRPVGGAAKPAAVRTTGAKPVKKAPVIEDLDVDQFMDGSFLDDASAGKIDESVLDDDDAEEGEDAEVQEDDDDDDDDDDEAKLQADADALQREMRALADTDPEFYSMLEKEDQQLLNFNAQEELAADDEDDQDATMDDAAAGARQEQEVLTMTELRALEKQCKHHGSIKALKKLVRIFRSAVHIGSVVDTKAKGESGAAGGAGRAKKAQSEEAAAKEAAFRHEVAIHSPAVFTELIRFMTGAEGVALWVQHFTFDEKNKPTNKPKNAAAAEAQSAPTLDRHPRWQSVGPILKAFLGHLLFFLGTLKVSGEQAPEQAKMARFVLGNLEGLVRFFAPFPRLAQKLLRELLDMWATCDHHVRIDAFLRIRQLAIELTSTSGGHNGESMLELTLKGIYLTYVRHTKFTSALTLPVIEFMANCVVEIYGLDPVLAYQHAFVYIRQLAIHLRQALLVKKKDAHRAVYNWNYVNCLRVWAKVLAVHGVASASSAGQNGAVAAADNLAALVYPFVQVSLGTLGVLPSSRYFPLRFHVARFLVELGARVHVFIPLAPHLLSVLSAAELSRKPVNSTRKVNDIAHVLKASKHVLGTKTYQEACVNEALHLLLAYFNTYSYSIAFPELILPAVKALKRCQKDVVIHRIKKQVAGFVLKLEHNASWLAQKRNACNWAPKDLMEAKKGVDGIDTFRDGGGLTHAPGEKKSAAAQISPLEKYTRAQAEERKLLDETKADWNGSKTPKVGSKKKQGADSDDEDDEEEERARSQKRGKDADDDEEIAEDEYDEDDDFDDDEDMEDGEMDNEGEDEDASPRKKSKANGGVARKPFEMPDEDDEADAADADQLEELAFSDDDDAPKKKNRGGKKHAKKGGAAAKSGDKRKRA